MSLIRKSSLMLAVVLCLMLVMTACGSPTTSTQASATTTEESTTQTTPAEKIKLTFYGKIVEYKSGEPMCAALQEKFKDKYDLECIQVDWANLDKVIRTGIASGNPADVYTYWPAGLRNFVDSKMCLDLTPYLEADGGAWKNTFMQSALEAGKFDGNYYGLPQDSNFPVIYANADLLAKAGVTAKSMWTWDEFVQASEAIKEDAGVYPFVISQDLINWIPRYALAQVAKKADYNADDFNSGKISLAPTIFVDALKNVKAYYAAQYMYPGEGSITQKRDEAKAAFIQGKVAILGEVSSFASELSESADFEIAVMQLPTMADPGMGGLSAGYDGVFVPSNAAHPDASVEILKAYLGTDIAKINADNGYATCTLGVDISNPLIKSLVDLNNGMSSDKQCDVTGINSKLNDYVTNMLMPDLCLANKSEEEILKSMDSLRAQK